MFGEVGGLIVCERLWDGGVGRRWVGVGVVCGGGDCVLLYVYVGVWVGEVVGLVF